MKRITRASLILAAILPVRLAAQDCDLGLTAFEEATRTFGDEVAALSRDLTAGFAGFARIEAAAQDQPDACPADLAGSRDAATALAGGGLLDRSDVLLTCGTFFNRRVLSDIATAQAEGDSQLMLRLGEVQQRIFAVEVAAIDATQQATFLGLRADALVAEHDALQRRCDLLGDVYD